MLVNDCMTRHPIMISPDTLAVEAQKIMTANNIRHLPVIGSGKKMLGLITRHSFALAPDVLASLDVWDITRYLSGLSVSSLMIPHDKVFTIAQDKTVERAARIMSENKVGCLPVIEDGIVVGIITEIDIMAAFQELLGLPAQGVRVTVRMPNQHGEFAKLTSALGENKMGVMGIGTYPSRRQEGYYDAVLKLPGVDKEKVQAVLGSIEGQEIIDIRDVV